MKFIIFYFKMPNLKVPVRACKFKDDTAPYIRQEVEKRVRAISHLPDSCLKKYRMDTIKHYNQAVRRIKERGQLTLTQVLKKHHFGHQINSQQKKRVKKMTIRLTMISMSRMREKTPSQLPKRPLRPKF